MKNRIDGEHRVVSFAGSKTYELVRRTHIHAHPLKRGFPNEPSRYLMVRATGGISHELFVVENYVDFNPIADDQLECYKNMSFYDRLREYVVSRRDGFGFNSAPQTYRFYILKPILSFDPCFVLKPNTQGYLYYPIEQFEAVINRNESFFFLIR